MFKDNSTSIRISDTSFQHEDSTVMDSDNQLSQSSLNTGLDTSAIGEDGQPLSRLVSSESYVGEGFRVYRRRWGILAQFCSLILANATMWVTFAPISNTAEVYFGTAGTTTRVNMLAVIFLILYPVGTVLEVYCMNKFKLRKTLLIGGALSVVGSLLRLIATLLQPHGLSPGATYGIILFGQVLAAVAQPLFLNCPAIISSAWFPPSERDISTSCGSLFSPLGNAVGSVLPVLFVAENQSDSENANGMEMLMLTEFLICVVPLVIAYFLFEAAPPTAPSYSALAKHALDEQHEEPLRVSTDEQQPHSRVRADTEGSGTSDKLITEGGSLDPLTGHEQLLPTTHSWQSTWTELHALRNNKNYCFLFSGFCLGLALFTGLLTFVNQIVLPFGYSNDDAGTLSASLLVSGLVGAAIVSQVLEKTKAYETVLKVGFVLCLLAIAFMITQLRAENFGLLCFSFCVLGFALLPMLPTVIENTAECTYPDVSEDLSVGLLFMGGNVLGIAVTSVLEALLKAESEKYGVVYDKNGSSTTGYSASSMSGGSAFIRPSNIFMSTIIVVSVVILWQYKGDYRRLKAERAGAQGMPGADTHTTASYQPPILRYGDLPLRGNDGSHERDAHSNARTTSNATSNRPSSTTTISDDDVLTAITPSTFTVSSGNSRTTVPSAVDKFQRTNTNSSFKWGLSDLGTLSQRETIVSNQTHMVGPSPARTESNKSALQNAFKSKR